MMYDAAVEKAKAACSAFLANPPQTGEATTAAMEPVIKAATTALAAVNLTTATSKIALEIYSGYRDADAGVDLRQWVKISLNADGKLVKEDKICCKEGCHTFGKQTYFVDVGALVKNEFPMKDIVENISRFLNEPNLLPLSKGMKN